MNKITSAGFGGLSRDNYINSVIEIEKSRLNTYNYDKLTEAEKNDFITVNAKKYVTALYHVDGQKRTAAEVKDIYQDMTTDMGAMAQLADDGMNEEDLIRELMTCDDEIFDQYKNDQAEPKDKEYNVEVLNALAGAECMLCYHPNKTDGLNEVHKLVKEAMEKFHKLTGVTLNDLDELR